MDMDKERAFNQGDVVRHFKGDLYQIVAFAYEEETMEKVVVYQALYGDFTYYTRKLDIFLSKVDKEKYPDSKQKYRFEKISTNNLEKNDDILSRKVLSNNTKEAFAKDNNKKENDADMLLTKDIKRIFIETLDCGFKTDKDNEKSESAKEKFLKFLEAKYYSDKTDILVDMKNQNMLNERLLLAMAVSIDCIIEDGSLDEQYRSIKSCLDTLSKFQIRRDKEIKVVVR